MGCRESCRAIIRLPPIPLLGAAVALRQAVACANVHGRATRSRLERSCSTLVLPRFDRQVVKPPAKTGLAGLIERFNGYTARAVLSRRRSWRDQLKAAAAPARGRGPGTCCSISWAISACPWVVGLVPFQKNH